MSPDADLNVELRTLEREWRELTRVPESPRTVMSVIEYSLGQRRKAEEYVNRLLRYFLDPEEPHGMDTAFLRAFLEGLPEECSFDEDTYDLTDVQVTEQVRVETTDESVSSDDDEDPGSAGIVDLVVEVPREWFLLVELKFRAGENNLRGEGPSQTESYYRTEYVGETNKSKYETGGYYLYLHYRDEAPAREPQFGNWTWQAFVNDVLDPFLTTHAPRFPQRTVNQLGEFRDDLKKITEMTEKQHQDRAKLALYLEHYDAIRDVIDAFDVQWETFTDDWHQLLATELAHEYDVTTSDLGEGVLGLDVTTNSERTESWRLLTRRSDWGMIFREGWWRHTDDLRPVTRRPDDRSDVRIGFHHRLDRNRDLAIGDHELRVYFRDMGANDQAFIDAFTRQFRNRRDEIAACLPPAAELTGNRRNLIQATYDIRPEGPDDFFEAYVSALATAFEDLVIENPDLIDLLTEIYDSETEMYR